MCRSKPVFCLLIVLLFGLFAGRVVASDGFDNNYVGSDANQLLVLVDGTPRAVVFGPGQLSTGGYYVDVPNGLTVELGSIHFFRLTQIVSFLRSAYLDRVQNTTFYYRLYAASAAPPAWTPVSLAPVALLDPDSCYTTTQTNVWETPLQADLIQPGMGAGPYVFEFYIDSQLLDVGQEAPDPCDINASWQCNAAVVHPGRFLSSRLSATDPSACNFAALVSALQPPSRLSFTVASTATTAWGLPPAFRIFPNPVSAGPLYLDLPPEARQGFFLLTDAAGQVLQRGIPRPELPFDGLPAGCYTLLFFGEDGQRLGAQRILKNDL